MIRILKYTRTMLLLLGSVILAFSCVSDDAPGTDDAWEKPNFGDDVYSLSFTVTLDNMGASATRAISDSDPERITKYENYINLERFRLLFFDNNDKFLFEAKNRWIKQIDINDNFSSWYISVPFGPFGDDSYGEGKEYDWDLIRDMLTSDSFKVAILANRPSRLLYPGFLDSELELPGGVFDNDGPYWGPQDRDKDIFDLHHYQYDIIYADKGAHSGGAEKAYYDFVMGDIHTDRPTMGSVINWVSFDNNDNDKVRMGTSSVYMRNIKMPSEEHPIPMYGMQRFNPIPKELWKAGTPFDLSNIPNDAFPDVKYEYKTVALLRSCVRLDLRIPKTVKGGQLPKLVSLWYSNIYSRCEPMDTWTPTNDIWKDDHEHECEWLNILNYGPVSSNTAPGNGNTKADYQKRISWFYGAWLDKGWKFETLSGTRVTPVAEDIPYPRVFNPCIQRNKVITCQNGYVPEYNDGYYHWVVYTGERNINDPNTLPDLTSNPYIACFVVSWDNAKYYCIPLLNYAQNTDSDVASLFGPHTDDVMAGNWPAKMNTYINSLPSKRGANVPYPLLRNHIYRFTLTNSTRAGDIDDDVCLTSEVLQTSDIDFSEQVQRTSRAVHGASPAAKTLR